MAIKSEVLGGDPAKIDTHAEALAEAIGQAGLTTSQVRNFYGAIAKLRAETDVAKQQRQVVMHRSRLAYLTARADRRADKLWDVFGPLLKEAKGRQQISAVCDFAEAVVAYHKFFEERNKRERRSHGNDD